LLIKHLMVYRIALFMLPFFLFASCIGVKADISVRPDGSGKMAIEYRVSQMAEALGRLDGNQRWQTVPVGRADFERSMARLPALRLSSFSSTSDGKDTINRAELEFKKLEDLPIFLDPPGRGELASFSRDGKNRLSLTLSEGAGEADADLLSLVRKVSDGYAVSISMSVPKNAELALTGGAKEGLTENPSSVRMVSSGKKVSFAVDTGELLSLKEGLGLELCW
jgi:hypothetical protein